MRISTVSNVPVGYRINTKMAPPKKKQFLTQNTMSLIFPGSSTMANLSCASHLSGQFLDHNRQEPKFSLSTQKDTENKFWELPQPSGYRYGK